MKPWTQLPVCPFSGTPWPGGHPPPNQPQRARELVRLFRHPALDSCWREPAAALDLLRLQRERAVRSSAINPDKFLAGFRAGGEFEKPLGQVWEAPAQLLPYFPNRAGIVILATVQMPGGRRVPFAGKAVLLQRALLQKQFAQPIEHQHMHRAMFQAQPVDFPARLLPDDLVALVDDVKNLFLHRRAKLHPREKGGDAKFLAAHKPPQKDAGPGGAIFS